MMIRNHLPAIEDIINEHNRDLIIVNGETVNTYEKWKTKEIQFNETRQRVLESVISKMETTEDPLEKIVLYKDYKERYEGGLGRPLDVHLVHTLVSQVLNGDSLDETNYKWEFVGDEYRYQYGPVLVKFDLHKLHLTLHDGLGFAYHGDFTENINPIRKELLDKLKSYIEKPIRIPNKELYNKCFEWVRVEPRNKRSFHPTDNNKDIKDFKRQFIEILVLPHKTKKFIERLEHQEEMEVKDRELLTSSQFEKKTKTENAQELVIEKNLVNAVERFKNHSAFTVRVPEWFPEA